MLTEDEVFLDIDPGKVALRFPPQERARKFGTEGTPGTNCIKIGLPGKLILSKRKGLWEVLFS